MATETPWDWENPLTSRLHDLLDLGFETDFTLLFVEQGAKGRKRRIGEMDVHKIFLMMGSKRFYQRVKGTNLDILEVQVKEGQVELELFQKMIEFLYVENIEVDIFQAVALKQLAKEYEAPRLVRFCEGVIDNFLNDDNGEGLGPLQEVAMEQGCQELVDECIRRMRPASLVEKGPASEDSVAGTSMNRGPEPSTSQNLALSMILSKAAERAGLNTELGQAEGGLEVDMMVDEDDADQGNTAEAVPDSGEGLTKGMSMCDKEMLDFISVQAAQDAELLIQTMSSLSRSGHSGPTNKRLDALKRNASLLAEFLDSSEERGPGVLGEGRPEWLEPIMAWMEGSRKTLKENPSQIIYSLQFSKNLYDWLIYLNNAVKEDQIEILAQVPLPEKSVSDFAAIAEEPGELPIISYYRQRMIKPDASDEQVAKVKVLRQLETARIRRAVLAFIFSALDDICEVLLDTNMATARDGVPTIKQVLESLVFIMKDGDQCATMISEKFMDKALDFHNLKEFNLERLEAFQIMSLVDSEAEDNPYTCWLCSSPPGFIRTMAQQGFSSHAKSNHIVKRRTLKCTEEECNKKFQDKSELKVHLKREHGRVLKRSKSMSAQVESPKDKKQERKSRTRRGDNDSNDPL